MPSCPVSKCCAGWLCALLACLLSADSQDDLRSTAFTLTLAILLLATGAASAVMILRGPWNGKEKKTNKAKGKAMAKAKAKAKAIPLPSHTPEPQPLTAFISIRFRRAPEANRGEGAGFPAPDRHKTWVSYPEQSTAFVVLGTGDYGEATTGNLAHTGWELSCWCATVQHWGRRSPPMPVQMVPTTEHLKQPEPGLRLVLAVTPSSGRSGRPTGCVDASRMGTPCTITFREAFCWLGRSGHTSECASHAHETCDCGWSWVATMCLQP